jgi:hypothetical protein
MKENSGKGKGDKQDDPEDGREDGEDEEFAERVIVGMNIATLLSQTTRQPRHCPVASGFGALERLSGEWRRACKMPILRR